MNRILCLLLIFILHNHISHSQDLDYTELGEGIILSNKDSSFTVNLGARFQTLYDGSLDLQTHDWDDRMLIRRARLKLDGYAHNPKLIYKIELALSNSDTDPIIPESENTANIILDAVLKYKFSPGWELWFGQAKLPGNRERLISSQKLQFVDRSLVNANYNIDRGKGVQLHHQHNIRNLVMREIASVSLGEGRNLTINNIGGYEYTFRLEVLPFGEFKDKGDYFGSDLTRETTPKLAIGLSYDQNNNAPRSRGFTGDFLSEYHDLKTYFIDAMFKYQGWSCMLEFADKRTDGSPLTPDGAFYTGEGINFQVGYLFESNFEMAGRYTSVNTEKETGNPEITEYTLGFSKYFSGHKLKIQSDVSHIENELINNEFRYRFQVELAF